MRFLLMVLVLPLALVAMAPSAGAGHCSGFPHTYALCQVNDHLYPTIKPVLDGATAPARCLMGTAPLDWVKRCI